MDRTTVFTEIPEHWALSFTVSEKGNSGVLLQAVSQGESTLTVRREENTLTVILHTRWNAKTHNFGDDPSFDFSLTADCAAGRFQIRFAGFSVRLYAGEERADEEWPLGETLPGPWEIYMADAVDHLTLTAFEGYEEDPGHSFSGPFHHYNHPGTNTGVGDCMPFERDGRWCLYYLLDRRGHRSKKGLGAHQWAQVSTQDLKHWTLHPMAVPITEQWEGSICTGSLLQAADSIYAFYAVRMADGSPARLSWAESSDGVHFRKSGQYFSLKDPYEPVSARDPKVFMDAEGGFHMLVTTSIRDAGRYGGCLAHLVSSNLREWSQLPPLIVPGYSDQPECSDYFEWNGWWYLVFSNFAVGRYRMARGPFGPWIRPVYDLLDATEVQVPKTAAFGNRRFSSGFLARRPRAYAGTAVTHELFQKPDGTLGVKHAEEMLPEAAQIREIPAVSLDGETGRSCASLPAARGDFRLRVTFRGYTENTLFGLNILLAGEVGDGKHTYRLEFDPAAGTAVLLRPGEDFGLGAGRDFLKNLDLSMKTEIDLTVCGDILDAALPDGRMMTMRLDESAQAGMHVELYVQSGCAEVDGMILIDYCQD